MTEVWTELWAFGTGRSRTYCVLAQTESGVAVDVFVGDTCIESHDYGTSTDAVRVAVALKDQYQHVSGAERVRMASFDFALPPSRDQRSVSAM